jgi:hypothetical protein
MSRINVYGRNPNNGSDRSNSMKYENTSLLQSYKKQRGLYARVAKAVGVDASYVSRVVNGQRHSQEIKVAVLRELARGQVHSDRPHCPFCNCLGVASHTATIKIRIGARGVNTPKKEPMVLYRCTRRHFFMVRCKDLRTGSSAA